MIPIRKRIADIRLIAPDLARSSRGTLLLGVAFLAATFGLATTATAQDLSLPPEIAQAAAADPWTYVALAALWAFSQVISAVKAHLEASRIGHAERAERANAERDKALDKLEVIREELLVLREERARLETRVMLLEQR